MNPVNSDRYRSLSYQGPPNIFDTTNHAFDSTQEHFSLFPEDLSGFIRDHTRMYIHVPDYYPNKGAMLCSLFRHLAHYFPLIVFQGPQSPFNDSNRETILVRVINGIEELYIGLRILVSYKKVLTNTDASSWIHPNDQKILAEQIEYLSVYYGSEGKKLVFTDLAQRLSEIDDLSSGALSQILDSLHHSAVQYLFNSSGSSKKISEENGFDAIMDAVLSHVSRAKILNALEVTLLFELLPKLSNKEKIDAFLKELPRHISKLVDLDKIVSLDESVLQRRHNSCLQKMVFTLDSWACSAFASDVLKALAKSISCHEQLSLDDTGILLYLLEEVASIEGAVDLMEAVTPHIVKNAIGFDLVDMSRTMSCFQYIKNNKEEILSALTSRLNTIEDSREDGDKEEFDAISVSCWSSFNYLRQCHKNANNFDDAGTSYVSYISLFSNPRLFDESHDSYDPDDPDNSYEIDTETPSFSWSACLTANSIQSLSALLQEQSQANAARKFISVLLKRGNYSFDIDKLDSIHEQQMLVKDILKDRRTKTQIDLRGLPVDLAEFYLNSVLNEIGRKKSVLPQLKLVYGSVANTIHAKSTFLPLTIVYGSNDEHDMKRRPKTLRSVVEKSISQELISGELIAKLDNGVAMIGKRR